MTGRAPRRPARLWRGLARGALLAVALGGPVAGAPADGLRITAAEYTGPTRDYPHGVLGDDLEWTTLQVTVRRDQGKPGDLLHRWTARTYAIAAPDQMVYEDIAPRLWDVTGDGLPEVVVVRSHQHHGAQLVIIGLEDGSLSYLAMTPMIGRRFRWLAPVGAVDLDGDGHIEVGLVLTPHLGKTLHVWRYRDGDFSQVATQSGLTNHKIGWDYIVGGTRLCGDRPAFVTASGDWRRVVATSLQEGRLVLDDLGPYTGPNSVNAAVECSGG